MSDHESAAQARDWWTAWDQATQRARRANKPHIFRYGGRWKTCLPDTCGPIQESWLRTIDFTGGSSIEALPRGFGTQE